MKKAAGDLDGVMIFHSMHRVMKAEKILKSNGIVCKLVNVPRQLSSDCGLAVLFKTSERGSASVALSLEGCVPEEVYVVSSDGYVETSLE